MFLNSTNRPQTANQPQRTWRQLCVTITVLLCLLLMVTGIYIGAVADKPKVYLVFASIPSLNIRRNSTNDSSITFGLLLSNSNRYAGVYYDNITVSLYDTPNRSVSIGNYSVPRFYQGFEKFASRVGRVEEDAIHRANRLANGSAVIRIDVATTVRLKGIMFRTKRRKIAVGANLPITDEGLANMSNKHFTLRSAGRKKMLCSWMPLPIALLLYLLLLFSF